MERLESILNKAEVMYLSTSLNDIVSSRPVSPLNIGLRLFIRTSPVTRKAKEMLANPNIAVCIGPVYFTGKARSLGSVFKDSNAEIKRAYISRYPDSFSDEDIFLEADALFFELTIENVAEWIYENNVPVGFAENVLTEKTRKWNHRSKQ